MKRVKARKDAGRWPLDARRREAGSRRWRTARSIDGHARFDRPHDGRVGDELLEAGQDLPQRRRPRRGARHAGPRRGRLPHQQLDDGRRFPAASTWWSLGGSYIGLEFAQMYRRFGSAGHDRRDGAAPDRARGRGRVAGDPAILEREGIEIRTERQVPRVRRSDGDGSSVAASIATEGPPRSSGSHLLLAVGPRPEHRRSRPRQGRRRRPTSAATSRSTTSCAPTCRASGRSATATAAAPSPTRRTTTTRSSRPTCSTATQRRVTDRIPAYALYIDPPLGRVGMTEARGRARSAGRALVGKHRRWSASARAVEKGETQGFMKILVDAETQADPRRRHPRHRRRRGDPLRARRHVREGAVHGDAARRAHPSHRRRAHPDDARQSRTVVGIEGRSPAERAGWSAPWHLSANGHFCTDSKGNDGFTLSFRRRSRKVRRSSAVRALHRSLHCRSRPTTHSASTEILS